MVRIWSEDFNPWTDSVEKVMVWVRFPNLPLQYYDEFVLKTLGNRIGKSIKVDMTTYKLSRGKFARLCVEIDVSKPLLPLFILKGREYRVEYEGLHTLCFNCGWFGHVISECPDKMEEEQGLSEEDNQRKEDAGGEEDLFGPWTMVKRISRKKPEVKSVGSNQTETEVNGSRFNALENLEVEEVNNAAENQSGRDAPLSKMNERPQVGKGSGSGSGSGRRILKDSDKNNRRVSVQVEGSGKGKMVMASMPRGNNVTGTGNKGRFGKENFRSFEGGRNNVKGSGSKGDLELSKKFGNKGDGVRNEISSGYLLKMKELGEKRLNNIKSKPPDASREVADGCLETVDPLSRLTSQVVENENVSMLVD